MSNPSEEVMKLARDMRGHATDMRHDWWPTDTTRLLVRAADALDALTADRASCQARVEALTSALRDAFCPRPCNHRPDHFEVGQCVDANECGCSLGSPLLTPEQRAVVAKSRALADRKEGDA